MSTFVLTPAAEDDLAKIVADLEGERPSAVVRVLGTLEEAMQLLADNPGIGHLRPDRLPRCRSGKVDSPNSSPPA